MLRHGAWEEILTLPVGDMNVFRSRETHEVWNFNKFIVLANLIKFLFKMEHTHVLGRATRFPDLYGTDSLLIKNGVMCLTILESLDKHLF